MHTARAELESCFARGKACGHDAEVGDEKAQGFFIAIRDDKQFRRRLSADCLDHSVMNSERVRIG